MKVVFLQDYKWYPNGHTLQSFGVLEKHDLDEKLAKRLLNAKIAELDEPKQVKVEMVEKSETAEEKPKEEAPKKRGRKPKAQDKRVKKETVEEK